MSARGLGRNAGRNRGGHIGPDGLRARERELLNVARAGEPLTADQGVMLLERLGRVRHGLMRAHAEHVAASPSAALAKAYDELCSAFVLLLHERDLVDARIAHTEAEADRQLHALNRRARADAERLIAEIARLRDERDEYRDAARAADGQRIALQRALGLEDVLAPSAAGAGHGSSP